MSDRIATIASEQIRAATGEIKRHRDLFDSDVLRSAGLLKATRTLKRLTDWPRDIVARVLLFAAGYLVLPLDDGSARVVVRIDGTTLHAGGAAEGFTLERAQYSGGLRRQRRQARRVLTEALPKNLEKFVSSSTPLACAAL